MAAFPSFATTPGRSTRSLSRLSAQGLAALVAAGLMWAAPSTAPAQTPDQTFTVSGSFGGQGQGTGTVSGSFTYNVGAASATSGTIVTGAGMSQDPNSVAVNGATYSVVDSSNATRVTLLAGPAAVGQKGISLFYNPGLTSGNPVQTGQLEFICNDAACGAQSYFRQGIAPKPAVTGLSPATGPAAGGTVVTITGTVLTGATAVTFGGVAATNFTVNSATSITATAPAHATGSVDVLVTTPNGVSANTAADNFTYGPVPVPTMTEWAMILFGLMLACGAALLIQRRGFTA